MQFNLTTASNVSRMFLMASNRTTEKTQNTDAETSTEAKPFSFSRLFHRNGHEKKELPPVKPQGPPKSVWREYFESAVVTVIMALFGGGGGGVGEIGVRVAML